MYECTIFGFGKPKSNSVILVPYEVIKCDGTTIKSYQGIMENNEVMWQCLVCKINFQHVNIPFTLYDDRVTKY